MNGVSEITGRFWGVVYLIAVGIVHPLTARFVVFIHLWGWGEVGWVDY